MIDPAKLEIQRRAFTDPQPAPEKYRIPAEFMARLCSECRTKPITDRNKTGVCRDCWNRSSRKKKAEFKRRAES